MNKIIMTQALEACWDGLSAFESGEWSASNPARGQCAVSSLVVQDYLGGEVVRFVVRFEGVEEKHFVNLIEGDIFDTTSSQYSEGVKFVLSPPDLSEWDSVRAKLLADEDTKRRYEYLKNKVAALLGE